VLERGEERVELGERGAVGGFEFVDGGDAPGEFTLCLERREWDHCLVQRTYIEMLLNLAALGGQDETTSAR